MAYTYPGDDSISKGLHFIGERYKYLDTIQKSPVSLIFGLGRLWITFMLPSAQRRAISSPEAATEQGTLLVLFSQYSLFIDLM